MATATNSPVVPSAGYPPFDPRSQSRFDLSTFGGRVRHFYTITDPRTLFKGESDLQHAKGLLQAYGTGSLPPDTTTAQLWRARELCQATYHPDTGEKIFAPLRFSAFAICNVPIVAALMYPTSSIAVMAGGQWLNQTFNVAVNYANRNASSEMSMKTLGTAYGAAVLASCSLAIGLNQIAKKVQPKNVSVLKGALIRASVPYMAVVGAGIVNLLFIRQGELTEGINVQDEYGHVYGKSTKAGENAIAKCSAARALWTLPMVLPSVIMAKLRQVKVLQRNKRLAYAVELGLIALQVLIFVPPALAVFPQQDSLPVDKLEPQFQGLKDKEGKTIERLYFNKGL